MLPQDSVNKKILLGIYRFVITRYTWEISMNQAYHSISHSYQNNTLSARVDSHHFHIGGLEQYFTNTVMINYTLSSAFNKLKGCNIIDFILGKGK